MRLATPGGLRSGTNDAVPRDQVHSSLSVILPVLNEAEIIEEILTRLQWWHRGEIIVVDGGSRDETVRIAGRQSGVTVISSARGRGTQMNAGARVACSDVLLFLHADTYFEQDPTGTILEALRDEAVVGGSFRMKFTGGSLLLRFFGWFTRFDAYFSTFGDQAYFVRADAFHRVGCFPDWPVFEDVELRARLKRAGKFVKLKQYVVTSPRRLENEGILRRQAKSALMLIGYKLGVPPARLKAWYR